MSSREPRGTLKKDRFVGVMVKKTKKLDSRLFTKAIILVSYS
jgi:hypothetical protein